MKKSDTRSEIFTVKRILPMLIFALVGFGMPAISYAQSCSQVTRTIRGIDRNRDFRNLNSNTQTANNLSRDLTTVERAFVRAGCQRALNAGQTLSQQCRTAARQITRGRRDLNTLQGRISSGNALTQQRAQLSQRVASGNCGTQPANFFEQLFDSLSGNNTRSQATIQEEQRPVYGNTVRSVCVRKTDGYYWPVSFSTVQNFLGNDKLACQTQCPGVEVDLYYYKNPGQEPKDMINLAGEAYAALPSAFAYRNEYDTANSCQAQANLGKIELEDINGSSRAFLSIDELKIPLPIRDPRHVAEIVIAEVVHVPLPRPRPRPAGAEPLKDVPVLSAELRVVEVNGRVVRIVGPDTPYARSTAVGT